MHAQYTDVASASKKIIFSNTRGDNLTASLEMPLNKPLAYALFAHCFTCSKDTLAAVRISRALVNLGIAVLRFDFTGLGSSAGDFANTNFSSNIDDLLAAATFLRNDHHAPQILIGHSLGGAAILAVAEKIPEAQAIVTIGAPADAKDIERILGKNLQEIREKGEAEVDIAGRKFRIKQQFLDDLEKQRSLKAIATLKKPLLLFHSPQDAIVGIENAYAIFAAANTAKSFITLDGADHLLTHKQDAIYVADVIAAWASRYVLALQKTTETKTEVSSAPGEVIVQGSKENGYAQEIIVGHHLLTADEPIAYGGSDLGPSPYEFLLASLGVCTSITLRMYADRHKIPLEKTLIKLKHDKIDAEDCKNCENSNSKIDHIDVHLELQGNLTEEQRAKLLEIASKCPVHRTLTSKIVIDTTS